jgi:hypothetical protein
VVSRTERNKEIQIKVHLHRSKGSFVNAFVRDIYGYIYMNE